ncbi:MAG: hypothetical protein B6241_09625 [Spirochaetaceae bacterium 4572_59]|nr:MAG: hypothetical protein B6241_09625 [Spirochaetaceae bacterium 4572_59]
MREPYKGKIFKVRQFISLVDKAIGSKLSYGKELKLIDKQFQSHIMLAVTQVNGCKFCSYVHTKQALESGSSQEDIAVLMEGNLASAASDERVALLFAQHYADSSGAYDEAAFDRVIDFYGKEKALGILATVKIIMMGNAHGGTMSFLGDRFRGMGNKESSFAGELAIFLGFIVILPVVLVKNLFVRSK